MSDTRREAVQHCPAWCSIRHDPDCDPAQCHVHKGLESSRLLSFMGDLALNTSLIRSDTRHGAPKSNFIDLTTTQSHSPDERKLLVGLTPEEAEDLVDRLRALIDEARRDSFWRR